MKKKLVFDIESAATIAASDSVGAYVRSGEAGALITHHSPVEAGVISFGFADGDVTVGSDTINEVAHGLFTGNVVRLTSTGTLPAGLALATDYFVIRVDANNFKLAASARDAELGIAVDITAAASGGVHTVTEQERERRALDVYMVNEIDVNLTQDDEVTVFQGTDPWIIGDGGGSITVDAVNLDIRDLAFATDKVDVSGSEVSLDAATLAALETINAVQSGTWDIGTVTSITNDVNIADGGNSITVDAVNLDIRELAFATDSVTAHQGGTWTIDSIANAVTVTATDLDIRDLTAASDSVQAWAYDGAGTALTSTLVGSDQALDVNLVQAVDPATANTAIQASTETLASANTAQNIVSSVLANRKYLFVYNDDNRDVFIGQSGVTAANGYPLSPGSEMVLRVGAAVDVEFVGDTGTTPDIRTLQLS